jgi:hypothetical protein
MNNSLEKGNSLEHAVRAIETAILDVSPTLNRNKFLIDSKRIVSIAGVHHEIDIWVEVDIGNDYKSIFIFECKNWEEKVGKNEIIVFSEKIKAVQAQKGFFVAKSYTKDAEAQSNSDPRIKLLFATQHDPGPAPFEFHCVSKELKHIDIQFSERSQNRHRNRTPIDIKTANAILSNEKIDFMKYTEEWANVISDARLKTFDSATLKEGVYPLEAKDTRIFRHRELKINNSFPDSASLKVIFNVQIVRPKVISDFEITSRGRVTSFDTVNIRDGSFSVDFISTVKNESAP